MKKLLFLFFSVTVSIQLFAQKIAMPTTPVTDSVKAKRLRTNKMQDVDGIKMGAARDMVENIRKVPRLSILLNAINAAGLTETFKSRGPITLFAPTNAAFQKMKPGQLDTLMKQQHSLELNSLITCHAVAGRLNIKDITKQINSGNGKATLTTIAGCKITASLDPNRNIVLTDENGSQCIVETFNLEQNNGVIHIINGVLTPKAKAI